MEKTLLQNDYTLWKIQIFFLLSVQRELCHSQRLLFVATHHTTKKKIVHKLCNENDTFTLENNSNRLSFIFMMSAIK